MGFIKQLNESIIRVCRSSPKNYANMGICSLSAQSAHHDRSNFLERVGLGMAVELSAMQCQNAGSAENTVRYSESWLVAGIFQGDPKASSKAPTAKPGFDSRISSGPKTRQD